MTVSWVPYKDKIGISSNGNTYFLYYDVLLVFKPIPFHKDEATEERAAIDAWITLMVFTIEESIIYLCRLILFIDIDSFKCLSIFISPNKNNAYHRKAAPFPKKLDKKCVSHAFCRVLEKFGGDVVAPFINFECFCCWHALSTFRFSFPFPLTLVWLHSHYLYCAQLCSSFCSYWLVLVERFPLQRQCPYLFFFIEWPSSVCVLEF